MRTSLVSSCRLSLAVVLLSLLGLVSTPAVAVDLAGLQHLDGSTAESDELGDNVVFVFFSSWSPKCRGIASRVNDLQENWGDTAEIVLVNFQEEAPAVEKFLGGQKLTASVFLDPGGTFSKKHNITYLPSLLAIKGDTVAFRGKFPSEPGRVLEPIYEK